MIIPIFIQRNTDCDNEHGYGCKCPTCLEKEKWENKPREYYKYRYAVPKSFILKNIIFNILCCIIAAIGFFLILFPAIFIDSINFNFLVSLFFTASGFFIFIGAFILAGKIIKSDFECKDKIYIEIKDSYFYPENWDDKIKKMKIPKKYKLTKEKSDWRYK